jgi:hypothetical protein
MNGRWTLCGGLPTTGRVAAGLWLLASLPAAADCAPSPGGPPFCLAGTVLAGDYRLALVQRPGTPGVERLRPGDTLGGWQVSEIGQRYLVVEHDDNPIRLDLGDAATPAPPPPGVGPRRPPVLPHRPGPPSKRRDDDADE